MMEYKLSDLFTLQMGKTPPRDEPKYWQDGSHSWISIADLSSADKFIEETKESISDCAVKESNISKIPEGTVIMSFKLSLGKVAITKKAMYSNEAIMAFIPRAGVDISTDYLYYLLKARRWDTGGNKAVKGITLNKATLSSVKVSIHSAEEQRQIVNILDKLKSVINRRQAQLGKLDELVKCRFVELFGDPVANDKGWTIVRLDAIADIRIGPFGSLLHKEDYQSGNHALVNPSHIVEGKIKVDSTLSVSNDKYNELSAYWLNPGDIVMGRRGEMGRCAVVEHSGLICGTGSLIIRTHGQMKPYFLQNILSRPEYKKIIEVKAVGVTMMNLNVPIVSSLEVPLLPHEQQIEFLGFTHRIDKLRFVAMPTPQNRTKNGLTSEGIE